MVNKNILLFANSIWFCTMVASPEFAGAQTVVNAGQVTAAAAIPAQGAVALKLQPTKVFRSSQTTKVLNAQQISAAGVVGGAAKALALAPGVNVASYGANGNTKTSISINGIKTGWAGFSGGNNDNGSVGVSFDGVPMVNAGNGLWQSTLVPQNSIIQGVGVTYGPGEPLDRWYTDIGGSISFVPLQPSDRPSAEITGTYGSYDTQNIAFHLQTGSYDGWKTIFAGALGRSNSFLKAGDGFKNGSNNYAYYFKTTKTFTNGDFSIGGYTARTAAYRPLPTPEQPIPGVTVNGYNQPGEFFSEATTGYYTALPGSVNRKLDRNEIALVYGQFNYNITDMTSFHNLSYFVRESRLHLTPLHDYVPGSESREESNAPYSFTYGDKFSFEFKPQFNDISVGGFVQSTLYRSQEQLWNPSLGFINSPMPTTALGSASVPNGNYFSDRFQLLDTAVFAQDAINPIQSLTITPGVRFINYATTFTPRESTDFPLAMQLNPGGDSSHFPASKKTFSRLEPSLGANWQALPFLALYASYARAYRQPENGGGTGPYVAIPASQVELEQGDYYQAGVKLHWDNLGAAQDISVGANVFHLNFSHETLPQALASGGALLAFGTSVYNGADLYAEGSPIASTYVFGNAGFTHAFFKDFTNASGTAHGVPVSYTPDITFNAGVYYKAFVHSILVEPKVTYQYTGAQKIYDNNQNTTSNIGLPPYGLVNLSADVDVPVAGLAGPLKVLTISAEMDNALGVKYNAFSYVSAGGAYGAGGSSNPTVVGQGAVLALPGPGRSFYVSASAKF